MYEQGHGWEDSAISGFCHENPPGSLPSGSPSQGAPPLAAGGTQDAVVDRAICGALRISCTFLSHVPPADIPSLPRLSSLDTGVFAFERTLPTLCRCWLGLERLLWRRGRGFPQSWTGLPPGAPARKLRAPCPSPVLLYMGTRSHTHMCTHAYMYADTSACLHAHVHNIFMHIHTSTHFAPLSMGPI